MFGSEHHPSNQFDSIALRIGSQVIAMISPAGTLEIAADCLRVAASALRDSSRTP